MIRLGELLTIVDDVFCFEENQYIGWFDDFIEDIEEDKRKYLDYIVDHVWIKDDRMFTQRLLCELSNPENYEGEGD